MWKWLLGPALTGVGWLAGSYYGANATTIVHKGPEATYDGFSQAIDNIQQSGTTHFEGGTPMPYELDIEREPGQRLLVRAMFAGREGAETELVFTPLGDGSETLVTAKVHSDHAVLRGALAGTSQARLAYAPDWMLNLLTMRPLLQQVAGQIEQGRSGALPGYESAADRESALPPDQREQVEAWHEQQAAAPTTNPDAAANAYLNDGSR